MAKLSGLLGAWLGLLLALTASAQAAPRVITLAPALTELAFAATITPVGVSSYSDFPAAAANIERVANWQGINVERILTLKPDVVLAWRGGNPQRQVSQLEKLGIKVIWLQPETLQEVVQSVRSLAQWSPDPAQAEQEASRLNAQLSELQRRYANPTRRPVFLQFGLRPMFTAAGNTLQNQVLKLCGGENIFADSRVPWPQVSREQVLTRHPQLIVTVGGEQQKAAIRAFWQPQLKVPIVALNDDWFSRPGPRILLAAQSLCRQLQSDAPATAKKTVSVD
ncbi:vitamin B12 ABC transporter substrate-binding protein BtuF [Izhakiella australiensis]|uniref:Vitamin B12-binding protein n=1 Tax=Izhakiella australiensis TaxID=1926881 RepID=A0A1S8YLG5_9GAMM|nr:vitamin B12 ABC transporter substrate-binding protein BtuF [Izhakiella australiensis]OON39900.1 vitamin B12 ABC transporter substrate-binding protein BtuF [Izhakiella australiensis]